MYSARILGLLLLVGVSALVVLLKTHEGFQMAASGPKCVPAGNPAVSSADCCKGGTPIAGGVVMCT